jgi:hypothetical protein
VPSTRGAARGAPPSRAATSQCQTLLAIDAIEALLAQLPAFSSKKDQQAPVSEPHERLRQLAQSLSKCRQRIALALIPQAGAMAARRHRGAPLAHLVTAHQVRHDLTLLDRL